MQVDVNLEAVRDSVISEGIYTLRVTGADIEESRSTPGAHNLVVQSQVISEGEYQGRNAFDNFSLQPQALWRLKEFITAVGGPVSASGFQTEDLLGRTYRATCSHQEYEGRARARWTKYARS